MDPRGAAAAWVPALRSACRTEGVGRLSAAPLHACRGLEEPGDMNSALFTAVSFVHLGGTSSCVPPRPPFWHTGINFGFSWVFILCWRNDLTGEGIGPLRSVRGACYTLFPEQYESERKGVGLMATMLAVDDMSPECKHYWDCFFLLRSRNPEHRRSIVMFGALHNFSLLLITWCW